MTKAVKCGIKGSPEDYVLKNVFQFFPVHSSVMTVQRIFRFPFLEKKLNTC